MQKKIDYELKKNGMCLEFKINYMDERFRALSNDEYKIKVFTSKNGVLIKSSSFPLISLYNENGGGIEVFLFGRDKTYDQCVSSYKFQSINERDEYYNKIVEAIADWEENWEGWYKNQEEIEILENLKTKIILYIKGFANYEQINSIASLLKIIPYKKD